MSVEIPLKQGLSTVLRGSTLAIRFGLVLYLARYLPPAQVGLFALYWAAVQLATGLLPLDLYAHTTRLVLLPSSDRPSAVRRHIGFLVAIIVVCAPLSSIAFAQSNPMVSGALSLLLLVTLTFELVAHDLGRLLLPLDRPLQANIVLFVRSALWVIPLVVANELHFLTLNLLQVILFWIAGSALACVLALLYASRAVGHPLWPVWDLHWVRKALRGVGWFFAATILFRTILGADRFLVEGYLGVESLAVYSVYASSALGVLGLLESGVSAWYFPRLVSALQSDGESEVESALSAFVRANSWATMALGVSIGLVFPFAIWIYLGEEYNSDLLTFYIIHFGVIIYSLSMPFHYVLYGLGKDRSLVRIYATAIVVMVISATLTMETMGLRGAGVMLFAALASIAVGRFAAAKSLISKNLINSSESV